MELCYEGGLVMPSSCAMMDEEEMTYVEGGKIYPISLTRQQCKDFSTGGIGVIAAAQLLNLVPFGSIAAFAVSGAVGVDSAIFQLAADHRGMTLNVICAGHHVIGMIPIIKW